MELKHLQALLGIADTGSFSAAATSIGTVQSNVSAHVARLERELDVQLVDRASGRLTEEGEVVVARARQVMNELEAHGLRRDGAAGGGHRDGAPRHDRDDRALAGAPALRPAPGAPPAHPPERRRGLERPAGAAAGLGPARPGRRDVPPERRRDHGGPALRRGPGGRPAAGTLPRPGDLAPPGAPLGGGAPPAGAGHRAAGRDRRRHRPRPHCAAAGHGARRRAPDRLAGLRRLRARPSSRPPRCPATCGGASRCSRSRASPAGGSAWPSAGGACPRHRPGRSSTSSGSSSTTSSPCPRASTPPERGRSQRTGRGGSGRAGRAGGLLRPALAAAAPATWSRACGPSPGSGTSSTTSNPWRR